MLYFISMKKLFLVCMSVLFVGMFIVFNSSISSASSFGLGIHDNGSEDDTIIATHDIKVGWVVEDQEEGFLVVVKSIVNWFLGILGLIALIIMLYGWFMMLISADNEEKYKTWWSIFKNAAIWLVLIGTAWFVLSLIFWLIVKSETIASAAGSGQ